MNGKDRAVPQVHTLTTALVAAAVIGMLPLAASRLGANTQFTPDQTDRDIRALEEQVLLLRTKVAELESANRLLRGEMQGVNARLAQFDTGIGRNARDFVIGGGDANKTMTMKLGRYYPTSIAMDGRDVVITADTIDLRGKTVRISATTAFSVNGGAVTITGTNVDVKGSKTPEIKGSKVLGN